MSYTYSILRGKIIHPGFLTRRTVGEGRPFLPENLGQTYPVEANKRFSIDNIGRISSSSYIGQNWPTQQSHGLCTTAELLVSSYPRIAV